MSKRTLKGRTKIKGTIGKTIGRSRGELVWSDELNRKTTIKIAEAIKKKNGSD